MDRKRAEEVAANRLQIILPLMDTALDKAKRQELKEAASIQYGISERTIRRWINNYLNDGFEGLKPKASASSNGKVSLKKASCVRALSRTSSQPAGIPADR